MCDQLVSSWTKTCLQRQIFKGAVVLPRGILCFSFLFFLFHISLVALGCFRVSYLVSHAWKHAFADFTSIVFAWHADIGDGFLASDCV